ncbi:MAG: tetratricopeptide repeat protein [Steroidobacteraceae bacterium]|nr:tetratricopeptide repeat protein [Steroidobacteraceae bacterium]
MNRPAADPNVATPPSSPIETEVRRVRELSAGGHAEAALAAAMELATRVPENRDVLLLIAANQRQLNRVPDALATLDELERLHPRFSRLYHERGCCHVILRDAPRAIDAFLRGVNINPAMPQSWAMLERLYRMTGDEANAATAAEHIAILAKLPPDVVQATSLFSDGDLAPAETLIRAFLIRHGNHVEAMRLLARIGIARDVLDDAELLLEAVLEMAPDYRAARHDYALVLIERHKYQQGRDELEKLLRLDPDNRHYRTLYATACVGLGEHARAIPLYRELLAGAPRAADLHLSIAHSLKTIGRRDEAIASYRAAAAVRPNFGDAYWSLANLKTYRFLDAEIAQMRAAEAAPETPLIDRHHLCFALGKAFEDRGDHAESWRYYERGNALKRSESRYRPEIIENNTRKQIEVCTGGFFAARRDQGAPNNDPIFIVGLPRSGSTLLEQILASHSRVEGTQELSDIQRMVLALQGREPDLDNPRYPGSLAGLSPEELRGLGDKYLADTRIYRTDKPHFIDKMPNNFRHIGLVHLILPNAKIIDARREPMACCFSNFKQLFANGQEFTYSLEDIARYYRTYLELMRHWDAVLPGRVLRVVHEDVVLDLEGNVRRLLDFCGLEFESACIDFHKNARSVRTASSEQVRRPIFREGLDQWRHYAQWLGPLRDALGDALTRYHD